MHTNPTTVTFSVIDEAVHLLDVPTAPWSIQLEVRVAGHLDEARLRAAFGEALGRHAMARVRKLPSRLRAPLDTWAVTDRAEVDPLRVEDCPDGDALNRVRAALQARSVPLTESPPLRAVLARCDDGDVLMLNLNHAAMDGFGALRLLRSIARAYAGEDDPIPDLDFEAARNITAQLKAPSLSIMLGRQAVLAARLRDLVAAPARVAPDGDADEAGYGFVLRHLSAEETAALAERRTATPGGVRPTVNDVLVTAMHLAIAEWNGLHQTPCRRIGVLVPANLRPREWRQEMVGNFSLPSRIATTRRSRRSPQVALAHVAAQTARKKKYGMGTAFIELLGETRFLPLWAKRAVVMALPLTGNRLVDTAMLSNVGRLDELSFGASPTGGAEARVEEMWFSPPARMPLGLTIGAATVNGQLFLVLRYRYRQFDESAAQRFAELYLGNLRAFTSRSAAAGADEATTRSMLLTG